MAIIKTEMCISILEFFSKRSKLIHKPNRQSEYKITKGFLIKYVIPVSLKLVFLNTLYYLFPALLIWLAVFLTLMYLGSVELTKEDEFFRIVTLFGILLGIYQYYLKRHEEKIAVKIKIIENKIEQIIAEETSFEKFLEFLERRKDCDDYKNLYDYAIKISDKKFYLTELFRTIAEDKELKNIAREFIKELCRYPQQPHIYITIPHEESEKLFEKLEKSNLNPNSQKNLKNAYDEFFLGTETKERISTRIKKEIDVDGFLKLAIANINIIPEVIPEFLNLRFADLVENIFIVKTEPSKQLESYRDYRNYLAKEVTIKILKKIFD